MHKQVHLTLPRLLALRVSDAIWQEVYSNSKPCCCPKANQKAAVTSDQGEGKGGLHLTWDSSPYHFQTTCFTCQSVGFTQTSTQGSTSFPFTQFSHFKWSYSLWATKSCHGKTDVQALVNFLKPSSSLTGQDLQDQRWTAAFAETWDLCCSVPEPQRCRHSNMIQP